MVFTTKWWIGLLALTFVFFALRKNLTMQIGALAMCGYVAMPIVGNFLGPQSYLIAPSLATKTSKKAMEASVPKTKAKQSKTTQAKALQLPQKTKKAKRKDRGFLAQEVREKASLASVFDHFFTCLLIPPFLVLKLFFLIEWFFYSPKKGLVQAADFAIKKAKAYRQKSKKEKSEPYWGERARDLMYEANYLLKKSEKAQYSPFYRAILCVKKMIVFLLHNWKLILFGILAYMAYIWYHYGWKGLKSRFGMNGHHKFKEEMKNAQALGSEVMRPFEREGGQGAALAPVVVPQIVANAPQVPLANGLNLAVATMPQQTPTAYIQVQDQHHIEPGGNGGTQAGNQANQPRTGSRKKWEKSEFQSPNLGHLAGTMAKEGSYKVSKKLAKQIATKNLPQKVIRLNTVGEKFIAAGEFSAKTSNQLLKDGIAPKDAYKFIKEDFHDPNIANAKQLVREGTKKAFNEAKTNEEAFKALASEMYDQAPPMQEVAPRALAASLGSYAGGALGTFLGPAGSFVGGLMGGALGGWLSDQFFT